LEYKNTLFFLLLLITFVSKIEIAMVKYIFIIITCISIYNTSQLYAQSDTELIKEHLTSITKTEGYRNFEDTATLNKVANYIHLQFSKYADTTFYQTYTINDITYKNVVCRFGTKRQKAVMVIGAHYDVCGKQEGADDNASGVVAVLELARLLNNSHLTRPVELVAYTLEEPPYFGTRFMGSYVHAKELKKTNTPVYGMIAVEMIGFFTDTKGSQSYPFAPMKVVYGKKGDFILLAKKSNHGQFVKHFSKQFYEANTIKTKSLTSPGKIEGVDFSDHRNYWKLGYDAMMITNSAFYRNHNYHRPEDTMESLDFNRMAGVIDAIYYAVINIDKPASSRKKK